MPRATIPASDATPSQEAVAGEMAQASRSDRPDRPDPELQRELAALRRRVAELERERRLADRVVYGDPENRRAPLLAQVPAILWLTDTDLRLVWWTGGGIEALDVPPEETIGIDIYTFLRTDDRGHPAIAAHRRALSGEASTYEVEYEGVFATAHVSPCYDADRRISGVIGVSIDITDRVRAETRLRRALERVNTLSGLIPICMHCKNVRNDAGYWEQVESYVHQHSLAEFTHAICPGCMERALGSERHSG